MRAGLVLALLMFVACTGPAAAQVPSRHPGLACSQRNLKDAQRVGAYSFKSYLSSAGGACLRVVRGGRIIFQATADTDVGGYTLGQKEDRKYDVPAIANGTDITGRGYPDMIVSLYTGGMHCCMLHYVFELEPVFRLAATLDAEHSDTAHFANLDGDGPYFYLASDWAFAYWPGSFADSPAPPVVLEFVDDGKGGGYHLALDKMARPAPTPAEWESALKEVRETLAREDWKPSLGRTLWERMLDFIYSGHSNFAWKLLDDSWPSRFAGKEDQLSQMCSILKTSLYWKDLAGLLKNPPPACSNAAPRPAEKFNRVP